MDREYYAVKDGKKIALRLHYRCVCDGSGECSGYDAVFTPKCGYGTC